MPRLPRIHVVNGVYFVTLRGSAGHSIITDEDDRIELERLIANAREPDHVRIHAYCWLERELHLAVQVADLPLGRFIQRIASPYAHRKQQHTRATGHFFAQRYDATFIDRAPPKHATPAALAHLVRYIHRAPIRQGRAQRAADYRWSSHRAYLGLAHVPWLTLTALRTFDRNRVAAREAFDDFVNGNGARNGEFATLREAAALRATLDKPQRLALPFQSIDELIDAACRTHRVTRDQLTSRKQHPNASLTRAVIAWHATRTGLATLKQVAKILGRDPSTLTVAIDRHRATNPHLFRHPTKTRRPAAPPE